MTAATQKAMSKTTEPIQPLLTTIAPNTPEHQNLAVVNFEMNELDSNALEDAEALNTIEGHEKGAVFLYWRRGRMFRWW